MSHEMDWHPLPTLPVTAEPLPSAGRCTVHTLGLISTRKVISAALGSLQLALYLT